MRKRCVFVLGLFCLFLPGQLLAAQPSERISTYIDKVLQVFQEPGICEGDCASSPELKQKLRELSKEIFDFRIMSRMSLAQHWQKLSAAEQGEFVDLFTRLLEDTYFGKVVKHFQEIKQYSRDKVQIVGETVFSSRKAEVKSVIQYQEKDIPVDYRLLFRDAKWMIYDVYVEGISLIGNYRKQFNEILVQESPGEMLQSLREKVEKPDDTG